MNNYKKFYINGEWVTPEKGARDYDVIHPGNEEVVNTIALGTKADVDKAVANFLKRGASPLRLWSYGGNARSPARA